MIAIKNNLLFVLLLAIAFGAILNPGARITASIGDSALISNSTGPPIPYGTRFMNFRPRYLFCTSEIEDIGGGSGNINLSAFTARALNPAFKMSNYRIRLKYPHQTELNTAFETDSYQELTVQNIFMPGEDWSILTLSNNRRTLSLKSREICARQSFASPFTLRDQEDCRQPGRQIHLYAKQLFPELASTQTVKIKYRRPPSAQHCTYEDYLSPLKYHSNTSKYKEYSV